MDPTHAAMHVVKVPLLAVHVVTHHLTRSMACLRSGNSVDSAPPSLECTIPRDFPSFHYRSSLASWEQGRWADSKSMLNESGYNETGNESYWCVGFTLRYFLMHAHVHSCGGGVGGWGGWRRKLTCCSLPRLGLTSNLRLNWSLLIEYIEYCTIGLGLAQ
jgi:hypothetical protein